MSTPLAAHDRGAEGAWLSGGIPLSGLSPDTTDLLAYLSVVSIVYNKLWLLPITYQ